MEAERRLVAEDPGWSVAPVTRPEPPEDQVRALGFREAGQLIDSPVFAKPITDADVIDPFVARESERGGLLRGEVAALRLRKLTEFALPFAWRLRAVHKRSTLWTSYATVGALNASPPSRDCG